MNVKCIVLLALMAVACKRAPNESESPRSTVQNDLVGVWDATISLVHPYPLEPDSPTARAVCGTLGLVDNHGRVDRGVESNQPMQIGVYDLALSRIGLEWSGEVAFPIAVAGSERGRDSASRPGADDSVHIVLNPGGQEQIVLLGRHDARGIEGAWTAQSARGTASGAFSLRPHTIGRERQQVCEG